MEEEDQNPKTRFYKPRRGTKVVDPRKNELIKCSTANCNKFYHLECCKGDSFFKYIDQNHTRFRCSLHYCQKCKVSGDSMAIA